MASKDFVTQDRLFIGYSLNKDVTLGYTQFFDTNLSSPNFGREFPMVAKMGYLNFADNKLRTFGKDYTLMYEGRFYIPTEASVRDHGEITEVRNYFTVAKPLSKSVTLLVTEAPIFYVQNKAGFSDRGDPKANANFENRLVLETDFNIAKGLVFELYPLRYYASHRGQFGTINPRWHHSITFYAELKYNIFKNLMLGVAFESDLLMKDDLSRFQVAEGFSKGFPQTILRLSL
jgi:hypothetical protein